MSPGKRRSLAFLLCLFVFSAIGLGQDAVPSPEPETPRREKTVYVPYDKLRQIFEQPGRGVFLPYEEFQALWDAAKTAKTPTPLVEAPIAAMITEMSGTATVSDEVVKVDSKISLELFKDGWHEIPLRLGDVAITSATIGGEPARLLGQPGQSYRLLVEKPKAAPAPPPATPPAGGGENRASASLRLELSLSFAKAIEKSPGRNAVSFDIPQAPLSRWKVVVPEAGVKVDFYPLIAASEEKTAPETAATEAATPEDAAPDVHEAAGETVFQAFVGPTPQIQIAWTPKAEGATGLEALTSVQLLQRSTVDEGILRSSARFDYTISRATISTLALQVPGDQKVVSVFDPNIRKWSVRQEEGKQIVDIELFEAARERQGVQLELERLLETPKDADRVNVAIPELSAVGVGRQQGILVVRTTDELSMETVKATGLLRMDDAELPETLRQGGQNWEAAYRISSTSYGLDVSVNKVEPRITAASQIRMTLDAYNLRTEMLTVFNVERTGVFQFVFEIPADCSGVTARGSSQNGISAVEIDTFTMADSKDNEGMKTLTVNLRRKAFGQVGLRVSYHHPKNDPDLQSPTGKTVEIPIRLPVVGKGVAERSDGRLIVEASDAFRLNTLELEGLQPVSVQQVFGGDWYLNRSEAQLGFLFAETLPGFKLQAERRKPQCVLQEVRTVRIEDGSIKHTAKFYYEVRFSGIKSIRIDVPEALSGRLNLRNSDNWRETRIVPPPEDVAEGYVAWDFATRSDILGSGQFEVGWEDELSQLDIGKSLPIDIPRLVPRKQQPSDRIWGQIVLSKSQSIDLGESEATTGLKPIDPQHDLQPRDRIGDAVAAFEYHDDWKLQVVATRYKLEEVKRTSIERGLVRANLFFSKGGTGISAQALFRIRSVQQRLELAMPESASISDIRINGQNIVLESDTASGGRPRFMIPLTTVPPDTPFVLDIRYTVEPPSGSRIEIPSFPGSAATETAPAVAGPAIQKVFLAAYVPADRILTGFRGNWSKDFSFHCVERSTVPANTPDVASILSELTSGITADDFSVSGNPYLFSAMHPAEDDDLTLTVLPDRIGAAVFAVLVLFGLLMLGLSWLRRFQAVILLAVLCVVLGYVYSTFGSLLAKQSAVYYGVLIVAGCWTLQALFECIVASRKRIAADRAAKAAVTETPANTENPDADNSGTGNTVEKSLEEEKPDTEKGEGRDNDHA